MIKSRLRQRRKTDTVTVKVKSRSNSQYSEATDAGLVDLVVTRSQQDVFEQTADAGTIVTVGDMFYFEAVAGESLPAIEEKHVLVDSSAVRYEVLRVTDVAGEGNRLMVATRRLR